VNKVDSPDLGFNWSLNPYQAASTVVCIAMRVTRMNPWDFSAGMDFEQNILVKKNAAELLREKLLSKNWKAEMISIAGNTDCYQPIERKLQITRSLLQVCLELQHPVGIITKNSLVERDMRSAHTIGGETTMWCDDELNDLR
jgi:DNA repair photolyase